MTIHVSKPRACRNNIKAKALDTISKDFLLKYKKDELVVEIAVRIYNKKRRIDKCNYIQMGSVSFFFKIRLPEEEWAVEFFFKYYTLFVSREKRDLPK